MIRPGKMVNVPLNFPPIWRHLWNQILDIISSIFDVILFFLILTSCHGFCNILTIKRGGGHIVPPLECLRYSWKKIAYRIGSNSNYKFTNMCCGHFDTILHVVLPSQAGQFTQNKGLVQLVTFPSQIHTYLVIPTSHLSAAKL